MKSFAYTPQRVCSKQITFDLDDQNKLHNVKFAGGCPGNLLAIGKLVEGQDAQKIADILKGNDCGGRGTSCGDQLSIAIEGALKESA